MPKPAILEKDMQARIEQGHKLALTIKATSNNEYFFQMQQGETTVVLTIHHGRVLMFKDLNRRISWAEAIRIHRIIIDCKLPSIEDKSKIQIISLCRNYQAVFLNLCRL